MSFGADLRRLPQERHLGGTLLRAKLVDDRVSVVELERRVLRLERLDELLPARQRILIGEVGVGEVVQRVDGQPRTGERIDVRSERREGPRMDAEVAHDGGGVGAAAVVERLACADRSEKERARAAPVLHDHHERRIGLVEVREIMKGGELIERTEVAHRRPTAEGDDDAVLHACGERIAARGELGGGNLGDRHGRQGDEKRGEQPGEDPRARASERGHEIT